MESRVWESVFQVLPDFRRAVLVVRGADNRRPVPELEERFEELARRIREDPSVEVDPRLLDLEEAFRSMGFNPKRMPPSVVNLVRRIRKGGSVPFVNPLVGIFNCVSLMGLVPCGGDDLRAAEGDLELRPARGDEVYRPLGRPEEEENPREGEIIYVDSKSLQVFCRCWCWKNGDVSKITQDTSDVAINVDTIGHVSRDELMDLASWAARAAERHLGAKTWIGYLDRDNRSFVMP
ncbi:MAG: phenylalanine--tRNA ligase beta subunit-related protein [Thermanaerothrix sp.]|nr:phenylalanine--tRNA ligase beta subunit-related protein [Thermanaerothrix sp.]